MAPVTDCSVGVSPLACLFLWERSLRALLHGASAKSPFCQSLWLLCTFFVTFRSGPLVAWLLLSFVFRVFVCRFSCLVCLSPFSLTVVIDNGREVNTSDGNGQCFVAVNFWVGLPNRWGGQPGRRVSNRDSRG